MDNLNALADEVERLEGPSREVDARIEAARGIRLSETKAGVVQTYSGKQVPAYTASLDTAMSLVPEGCLFTARTVWDKTKQAGLGFVSRYEKGEFNGHERLYWMDEHQAVAATPALALCAASLRALSRLSQAGEG